MSDGNPAWQLFAALQNEADPQSIDRSSARDEALDVVLDEIVSAPVADESTIRKRYYSLCRNRLSKQNNRRSVDRRRNRGTHRRGGTDSGAVMLGTPVRTVVDDLAYDQSLDLIRSVLPEQELKLLLEIADGHDYDEISRAHNMSVSGLKSKAFRIREKVRNSRISDALRLRLKSAPPAMSSRLRSRSGSLLPLQRVAAGMKTGNNKQGFVFDDKK